MSQEVTPCDTRGGVVLEDRTGGFVKASPQVRNRSIVSLKAGGSGRPATGLLYQ